MITTAVLALLALLPAKGNQQFLKNGLLRTCMQQASRPCIISFNRISPDGTKSLSFFTTDN